MEFLPTNYKTTTDSKKQLAKPSKLAGRHSLSNKETWQAIYAGHKNPPPFKTWLAVIEASNKSIAEAVLSDRGGFWLPHRLGLLIINKRKVRGNQPFIDRVAFCKTGQKVPQLNLHTFGYTYCIKWVRLKKARLPLKYLFTFQAVRELNRSIKDRLDQGHDYLEGTYKFSSLQP
ncbi:hypothetical protein GCM10028806_34130 [Spirosoma terrae]|uniref:Uncharacterized protein n=1 Tax=Spirosoma terrae TaxID=1968276 RepID=A0A6L9L5A2_9BACT|nr:hypothetical protein [Spirosoma terrae]NDU95726.1 hypothetical protein [Spirosoma terrae]